MTTNPDNKKSLMVIMLVLVVAIAGFMFLTKPDARTPAEKIGDAIGQLPNGPDKAARELEDRTPGERIGDAIKDKAKH